MAKQTLTTIKDEHFGIARKIVSNMTAESWETIPHCCATYDAEVTEFMRVLKEINSTISKEEKITARKSIHTFILIASLCAAKLKLLRKSIFQCLLFFTMVK